MGLAPQQVQPLHRCQRALVAATRALDHTLFALAYGLQFDRNRARVDAVLSALPCQIDDARAGDHRFCRGAAHVNTDPTHVVALN